MKINDIIQETTSAGGIATVASPLGGMQKRPNASVFANTTPKKKKKKTVGENVEPEITQSKAEENYKCLGIPRRSYRYRQWLSNTQWRESRRLSRQ